MTRALGGVQGRILQERLTPTGEVDTGKALQGRQSLTWTLQTGVNEPCGDNGRDKAGGLALQMAGGWKGSCKSEGARIQVARVEQIASESYGRGFKSWLHQWQLL